MASNVYKGQRPGRQRGVTANVGKIKLDNSALTDADATAYLWFQATSGDYKLSYGANASTAIAFDDNAAALEVHIEAITGVTAVTVTGGGTHKNPFKIVFVTPADTFSAFTISDNSLVNAWQDNARA